MLLGGSGLVGHAMARRLLAATPPPPPRRLVLVALFEDEVRAAARALEPYLTKLLYEAYLCGRVRSSVRALADSRPAELAASAHRLLQDDARLRQHIISVAGPQGSGSDVDWNAIDPDELVEPARFATWVFTVEDKGTRIKR